MIHKSIWLPVEPERAFAIFTREISAWWPPERRHTSDPQSQLFLEQQGRFWERGKDGHEVDLGRVRIWDEPRRLVLDFYVATGRDQPTEVEITFAPEREGTRLNIDHRATPASEELYQQRAPRFSASWDRVLECFAAACQR